MTTDCYGDMCEPNPNCPSKTGHLPDVDRIKVCADCGGIIVPDKDIEQFMSLWEEK